MKTCAAVVLAATLLAGTVVAQSRERFVDFPGTGEAFASPNGRFVIRNVNRDPSPTAFSGSFHALWLRDAATGKERKLCDYLRHVQVAWNSRSDRILVNDYWASNESRLLIFTTDGERFTLDKRQLANLLADAQAASLTENRHIYVEGSGLVGDALAFRVWGYGERDPKGFKLDCEYSLSAQTATCRRLEQTK